MPTVGCKKTSLRSDGSKRKTTKQSQPKTKETKISSISTELEVQVTSTDGLALKDDAKMSTKSSSKSLDNGVADQRQRKDKKVENGTRTSKITDYYPVRRSCRCTESELKQQKQSSLEENIRNDKHDGLKVDDIEGKGRGVRTTRPFHRGEFVVEYAGELVDVTVAKQRERQYSEENRGCYIYYFNFKGKSYCIDATEESGLLGRLVNHSHKIFNCVTKIVEMDSKPRLVLIASRDIVTGEEVLYDYGDRSPESLRAHPWLAL